jgi:hypothetical protein
MSERIYHTTNKVGTVMTYEKGTAELSQKTLDENIGTCAALSSIFLKNMRTNRPELSNPDKTLAQIVFARSWIFNLDPDKFNKAAITAVGSTSSDLTSHAGHDEALKHICRNLGHYYIDLREGHIVAAISGAGAWYFFDSNDYGLWRFSSANEFVADVKAHLKGAKWKSDATIWTYLVT